MRLAFVCDTPYQVLTATNLYWTIFYNKKLSADLYIVNQFKEAESIYINIKKEKLFDNVYFLKREKNRFMPKGFKRYFRVAYSYLNPKKAIKNQLDSVDGIIVNEKYDAIYSSVVTCFVSALLKLNKNAEFSLYDDGLGSYSGDIVVGGGGYLYRVFSKITKTGAYAKRAKRIYVNHKEMCKSKAADVICEIPKMNEEFIYVADRIFSVPKNLIEEKKIIFLSQPSMGVDVFEEDVQRMIQIIYPYKDDIIVRLHPRETNCDKYKDFQIDTSKEFWELKIAKMYMDNIVLIGSYSTAQITPKILFDKEPWLILTYQIEEAYHAEEKASYDLIMDNIKMCYRNPNKIMIPRTMKEFKEDIEYILTLKE